jgi:hypothetical protein
MAAQHRADDTVLRLRDSKTGELCAVRKSGSINLADLQQELMVSTVVECDYAGRPLPRAVTLTAPDEVLRSGRTYIATRHIKSVAAAAADKSQQGQQISLKPIVTFHSNVIVREYTLPPSSPGTPSAASSVANHAIRGMTAATSTAASSSATSRLSTPGQHLTFASVVLDATPRPSMPLASRRRPREDDPNPASSSSQLQRSMPQPAPSLASSSQQPHTQQTLESITVSSSSTTGGSGGEARPSPHEMHHFSFEGRMVSISSSQLSEMVRASSAFARSLDALDVEATELLHATHADIVASVSHVRQTRHEFPELDVPFNSNSGSGSGSGGNVSKHYMGGSGGPASATSSSVRVVG